MARAAPLLLAVVLVTVASGPAAAQVPPDELPEELPDQVPQEPPDELPDQVPQEPPEELPGPVPEDPPDDPPDDTSPVSVGSSESSDQGCASTDGGTTCHDTHRQSTHAGVDGAARVTVAREDHHVEGHHDGSDGTSPNTFEDHRRTRTARLDVEAGPAPASVAVSATNSTSSHRQTDGTDQGTDETRVQAGASAGVGGPLGIHADESFGVTYREIFAGDGYHRCEVDADGPAPAVGTTCPSSLADDSGLPPGGTPVP